jgi:hypothetical protein
MHNFCPDEFIKEIRKIILTEFDETEDEDYLEKLENE